MKQRERTIRLFRDIHLAVLKPRGFSLKKVWSVRRQGELRATVHVDVAPWAHDDAYTVDIHYGLTLPLPGEPVDLGWGFDGRLGESGWAMHRIADDRQFVVEVTGMLESVALPLLDRVGSLDDLVTLFDEGWQEVADLRLFPESSVKRAQFLAFFAAAAGRDDLQHVARERLITEATAGGMDEYLDDWLEELSERIARAGRRN